ncbi:hypothetical protein GCM10017673_40480 [Streptosporangium violaceochromogenes]|nr:hypothetical protein GCM10017673_40480 [Streptosporangium violaceochromogenes]
MRARPPGHHLQPEAAGSWNLPGRLQHALHPPPKDARRLTAARPARRRAVNLADTARRARGPAPAGGRQGPGRTNPSNPLETNPMRVQILLLPSVVVGDSLEEPFALIVDQHTAASDDVTPWEQFKADCGARAVLVTSETVEVVDRYADPTPEADHTDPGDAQLAEGWKLATTPFIQMEAPMEASDVDPFKVADELRFHLDKVRTPGQPAARQVIASALQDDWFFAGVSGHVGRLADVILAALDAHGLDIVRRGDTDPGNAARPTAIGYEHIERIARAFHETYERLAPEHGYATREASAVPWAEVPANNKSLMIAVVASLIAEGRIIPGEA